MDINVDSPEWVRDAVFYHIFLDRFANGDKTNDPANRKHGARLRRWRGIRAATLRA